MRNKTKDNIFIVITFVVLIVGASMILKYSIKKVFGSVLDHNYKTGTIYIDKYDYTQVLYSDGTSTLIGNENSEYAPDEKVEVSTLTEHQAHVRGGESGTFASNKTL